MRTSAPAARSASVPSLRDCKVRASLLLKALRSGEAPRVLAAAERLRILPHFAGLTPDRIAAWAPEIRRKHALNTIAAELGFASWTELRDTAERNEERPFDIGSLFDSPMTAVFLNVWCRTYEEAVEAQAISGGFIFPYRTQFVVAPSGVLEAHGIDAHDPDWEAIGRDWVRPRDPGAFARLRHAVTLSRGTATPHPRPSRRRFGP